MMDLEKLMNEAWKISKQSPCLKKKVGAVLYDPISDTIVGKGYGGAKEPCKKCVRKEYTWAQDGCWSIHSEIRALFDYLNEHVMLFSGLDYHMEELVMFVTHGPCDQCLKYMHFFGVGKVIYDVDYKTDYSKWNGKINILKLHREEIADD